MSGDTSKSKSQSKSTSHIAGKDVYIVDGARTPYLKAKGIGAFSASDLAVAAGRNLLNHYGIEPNRLDELILGCVMPSVDETNIARIVALRLGCGSQVPAYTVMRNCASGMQALDSAAMQIASGRSHLILAGGTDAMSHAPLLFHHKMADWLSRWYSAKTFSQKMGTALKFRPAYLAPVIALLRGLTDPIVGLNMGQTAEELAFRFKITREQMDAFALQSQQRAEAAEKEGRMTEITPIIDNKGHLYSKDDGIRPDISMEKLAKLKPVFDKKYGLVTAGNSSQITDGACMLLLASEEAVKMHNLPVLGRIIDSQWAALDPRQMGLGPVHAATPLLQRYDLQPNDLDCWEINEAFAAQVLACLAAWNDDAYCQEQFGLPHAIGAPAMDKLNKDGGAIAIGHPVGSSGARNVLHVLKSLKQTGGKHGMAAICIGGGQGGAMYLERLS